MTAMPPRLPQWSRTNLAGHHAKHPAGKGVPCWQDILSKSLVAVEDYEAASHEAITHSWLEYEAETSDSEMVAYHRRAVYRESRAYYVDDRELIVVASSNREAIISCYHEHYGRPHQMGRHKNTPVGERRNYFRTHLRDREQGGMVRTLKVVRDEAA